MKPRRAPWLLLALTVAVFAAGVALGREPYDWDALWLLPFLAYGAVGALVASHRPGNRIGWVFLAVGVFGALASLQPVAEALEQASGWAAVRNGAIFLSFVGWFGGLGTMLTLALLLFPDGRLPGPRWRAVVWITIVALPVGAFSDYVTSDLVAPPEPMVSVARVVGGIALALLSAAALASVASVVVRFRRSRGGERQQLKWFTYAAGLLAVGITVTFLAEAVVGTEEESAVVVAAGVVFVLTITAIPVSAGIAILRHRLYDIDVVINKTVVYGTLAAFITAVYVGIVVGIGRVIGAGEEPDLGLSIAATALVAVLFQPVRARVQRFANRLVYGDRASPYELLSRFSDRVAGSYAAEDVLQRLARVVADGTRARVSGVWLRVEDELRPAAAWPTGSDIGRPVPVEETTAPAIPGADRTFPVREEGQLVGVLTVAKAPGDPLRPAEEKLTEDLAAHAGLALRNVRLTAELSRRLGDVSRQAEELRESRRRLVAAQDRERRRLERDIHDGAQQHLVALAVNLNLAKAVAKRDRARARESVTMLETATEDALNTLRDLTRGLYPPLLETGGLVAALRARVEGATIPTTLQADGMGRFPLDVEAAVYFTILEALQNAAKYADASRVTVRLWRGDGELRFEVEDDGRGFDPTATPGGSGLQNMADRLQALGGTVDVRSAPGRGVTVTGRVPVPEREPVA